MEVGERVGGSNGGDAARDAEPGQVGATTGLSGASVSTRLLLASTELHAASLRADETAWVRVR